MRSNSKMLQVAQACPQFQMYVQTAHEELPSELVWSPVVSAGHLDFLGHEVWMTLIHLTCMYLAAKILEYVPFKNLLNTIMELIYGCPVPALWVSRLEREVLHALDYRLGPVFLKDT